MVITVSNQKGGVGKTTTSAALAAGFSMAGKKVLCIDLDPQGNLGFCLGLDTEGGSTILDVLKGDISIQKAISRTEGIDILPSDITLSSSGLEYNPGEEKESILKNVLKPVMDFYDYIVIDTPPALNLLTVNVLWSSFFVTLVAKKIVLINLCCRPCFIWGSITIITVWTNMIIINVCKFFYLLIECFLCCKLIQICAFILQGIEITLHRCIVVRISCFAHALCHIYRFAEFGKCFGRIL